MPHKQPPTMQQGHSNDFQTPPQVLEYLLPYANIFIKPNRIWECAAGNGNLSNELKLRGYGVVATDIKDGFDFLVNWMDYEEYDMIITNPPYTIKTQFLERAYFLKKPFAFLLPYATLETPARQDLFRANGLQIIFLPHRINFETPSGEGSGAWFATAWFTWGLHLDHDMIFAH